MKWSNLVDCTEGSFERIFFYLFIYFFCFIQVHKLNNIRWWATQSLPAQASRKPIPPPSVLLRSPCRLQSLGREQCRFQSDHSEHGKRQSTLERPFTEYSYLFYKVIYFTKFWCTNISGTSNLGALGGVSMSTETKMIYQHGPLTAYSTKDLLFPLGSALRECGLLTGLGHFPSFTGNRPWIHEDQL